MKSIVRIFYLFKINTKLNIGDGVRKTYLNMLVDELELCLT